jgi:thioredoxin 1
MSEIIDIQATDWEKEVAQEKLPVVIEYWHHKCTVCLEMKPTYEAQPNKFGTNVKFTKMNLLESKENRVFAIRGGVRSTPTFVIYCEGRPIGQIIGYRDLDDFTSELRAIIGHAHNCLMSTPIEE